jgi:hypothetical protein
MFPDIGIPIKLAIQNIIGRIFNCWKITSMAAGL